MLKRSVPFTAVVTAGLVLGAGSAVAYWELSHTGDSRAVADELGASSSPVLTKTAPKSPTVNASVERSATAAGRASGYELLRYATASGGSAVVTPTCSTGTPAACSDAPGDGRWFYSARKTAGTAWKGAESSRSSILVDSRAPSVSTTSAIAWSKVDVVGNVSATDVNGTVEVSGVKTISWTGTNGLTSGSRSQTSATPTYAPAGPTVTAEGTTVVTYTAVDDFGTSSATASQTVRIDKTAPAVTITSTSPTASGSSGTPQFSGTRGELGESTSNSADLPPVTVTITGPGTSTNVVSTGTAGGTGSTWTYTPSTALGAGTYTVRASQSDVAGNTKTVDRTYEVTSNLAVTSPTDGATNVSRRGNFRGTASAAGGTVTVKVYSGPSATGTLVRSLEAVLDSATGSWTLTLDNTSNLDQNSRYTVTASQGSTTSAPITFTTGTSNGT